MIGLAKKIRDSVRTRLLNADLKFSESVVEKAIIAAIANVFDVELAGSFQEVGFRPNTTTSGVFYFIKENSLETVAAAETFVKECIDENCLKNERDTSNKDSRNDKKDGNRLLYMNKDLADAQEKIVCKILFAKAKTMAQRDAAQIYELIKNV